MHHRIEHGQERAHTGSQGDFYDLPGCAQALSKCLVPRMGADSHEGTQRQSRADRGSLPLERAGPTPGPIVARQGRQTDHRREVLAAHGPARGPIEHERPRTPGAETRHTAPEGLPLPPDRAGPPSRIEGIITRHDAGMEPRARGRDIRVETARRTPKKAVGGRLQCLVRRFG